MKDEDIKTSILYLRKTKVNFKLNYPETQEQTELFFLPFEMIDLMYLKCKHSPQLPETE